MIEKFTFQQALSQCTVCKISFKNYYGEKLINRNNNILIIPNPNKPNSPVLIDTNWYKI
ncbi:MAG: hypothetical protein KQ78_01782 [Candidatus Izimaplasma bacterium HR2]|nr:MAG: hypothetical protein KQ78_01782 [Candidatus Izimaplasma bacterium HR2]